MPLRFPTSEFFESSGNAAAEFNESLRDNIVDFACGLWSNFPAFISNNKSPGTSFARGYMNSICQNRVPLPDLKQATFSGGQCSGVSYQVFYLREVYNITNCIKVGDAVESIVANGPIGAPFFVETGNPATSSCNGLNNDPVDLGVWLIPTGSGDIQVAGNVYRDPTGTADPPLSNITIQNVVRLDGMPDNCGNLDDEYESPSPTGNDLTTVITIVNQDGIDLDLNLTYNQLSPEFNFPIGFKLDGVNVTLDLSGLTIYGDQSYTSPNNNNNPSPPGSDGGDNGVDPPYNTPFPEQPWPVLPELNIPKLATEALESAICDEDTIQIISEVVQTLPGIAPPIRIILQILISILEEVCGEEEVQAVVGYPEYYSLKPGAGRPAIVYLYKTWDGSNYGASTYSATVNQPSASAVAEIDTVVIPDKTTGTFIASISLLGGTRLRTSGTTRSNAISNLNYLIGKVDPSILPPNFNDNIVVTEDTRLETVNLVCRQIEYYPLGAGANRSPTVRRVIDQ